MTEETDIDSTDGILDTNEYERARVISMDMEHEQELSIERDLHVDPQLLSSLPAPLHVSVSLQSFYTAHYCSATPTCNSRHQFEQSGHIDHIRVFQQDWEGESVLSVQMWMGWFLECKI